MSDPDHEVRHSRALEPELISDPVARAEAESRNVLRQYDLAVQVVMESVERQSFRLRLSTILGLHREALRGISSFAGNFRPGDVEITGTEHKPVGAHLVAGLVEEMCDYVNERWSTASPIHLAAYVMWRLNWIHPFADGNGRTSRITSFVVLSAKLGLILPGTPTLPELIVDRRAAYNGALDDADIAWKDQRVDVSTMEGLLEALLAKQLTRVYELASGKA